VETCDGASTGAARAPDCLRGISAVVFDAPATKDDGRGAEFSYIAAAFEEAELIVVGFAAGSFLVFTFRERENNSIDAAGQKIARLFMIEPRQIAWTAVYCDGPKVFPQLMETRIHSELSSCGLMTPDQTPGARKF
jgi:hypothetical protein